MLCPGITQNPRLFWAFGLYTFRLNHLTTEKAPEVRFKYGNDGGLKQLKSSVTVELLYFL